MGYKKEKGKLDTTKRHPALTKDTVVLGFIKEGGACQVLFLKRGKARRYTGLRWFS